MLPQDARTFGLYNEMANRSLGSERAAVLERIIKQGLPEGLRLGVEVGVGGAHAYAVLPCLAASESSGSGGRLWGLLL